MRRKRFWLGRESVRWPICVSNTNAPEWVLIVPPMAVNPTPRCLRAWHTPSRPDAHPHLAPLRILSTQCEHHGLRKALPAVWPHEDALPCSLTASVFLFEVLCVFQAVLWRSPSVLSDRQALVPSVSWRLRSASSSGSSPNILVVRE